jgi:hypothetical protein
MFPAYLICLDVFVRFALEDRRCPPPQPTPLTQSSSFPPRPRGAQRKALPHPQRVLGVGPMSSSLSGPTPGAESGWGVEAGRHSDPTLCLPLGIICTSSSSPPGGLIVCVYIPNFPVPSPSFPRRPAFTHPHAPTKGGCSPPMPVVCLRHDFPGP